MNTHTPRAQQHRQVQSLAVLAMFTAILFLLTFTPIGMIDLPIIKATVLHVPVIIGALLLGPKKGAFLGGMFGLASLLKNTLVPNLSSFAFSPLIPVPGLDRGSPWALVVCFVPRILVGVTPWLVYTLLQALSRRRGSVLQAGSMGPVRRGGRLYQHRPGNGTDCSAVPGCLRRGPGDSSRGSAGLYSGHRGGQRCARGHCGGHPCPRSVHPHGKGSQAQPRSPGRPGARLSHAADH